MHTHKTTDQKQLVSDSVNAETIAEGTTCSLYIPLTYATNDHIAMNLQ